MSNISTVRNQTINEIATEPIRRIVELHPEVMPILASHGLDLCCGGGHTVSEAARLHDLNEELVTEQIVATVTSHPRD